MIKISKKPKDGKAESTVGKLTLIDLAGSESLVKVGTKRRIYEEGLAINESLEHL